MCSAGCVFCWNQVDNRNVLIIITHLAFITENRQQHYWILLISRDILLFLNFVTEALYININIITIYYKTYIYHIFIYWRYLLLLLHLHKNNEQVCFSTLWGLFSTVVLWVRYIYLQVKLNEAAVYFGSPHYIEMTHL